MWKMFLLAVLGFWVTGSFEGQCQEIDSLPYKSIADEYAANRPFTWWRLNNLGEEKVYDTMGRYDGTKNFQGGSFDGKEARIDVGYVDVESGQMSILAWFRAEDFVTEDARIISKAVGINDPDHYWMLSTIKQDGEMRLRCRLKLDGRTHVLIAEEGNLETGKWILAAVVYDGEQIRLFQNCKLVGIRKAAGSVSTNSHARTWIGANPDKLGSKAFHGQIRDVALFKHAIPDNSIKAICLANVALDERIRIAIAAGQKQVVQELDKSISHTAEDIRKTVESSGKGVVASIEGTIAASDKQVVQELDKSISNAAKDIKKSVETSGKSVVTSIEEALTSSEQKIIESLGKTIVESEERAIERTAETIAESATDVKRAIAMSEEQVMDRLKNYVRCTKKMIESSENRVLDGIERALTGSEGRILGRLEDAIASCQKEPASMLLMEPMLPTLCEPVTQLKSWEGMSVADQFLDAAEEHTAPTVVLKNMMLSVSDDPTGNISSSDTPSFWTPVPYGQLMIDVKIPTGRNESTVADYIQLLLDGEPLNNNTVDPVALSQLEITPERRMWMSYRYELSCPPLGKHLLQARYLKDNVWSQLSAPLRFDVRLPDTPEILSVSDSHHASVPLRHSLVKIKGEEIRVKLGRVKSGDRAILFVDGEEVCGQDIKSNCCVSYEKIGRFLSPGIHTLTVRVAPESAACSLTSKPSNEVLFHYFNESAYIFSCDMKCPSGSQATKDTDPCAVALEDDELELIAHRPATLGAGDSESDDNERVAKNEFVFASSAYFPMRDFGPRGEVLDREGAIIYEDMVFAFNPNDGGYTVSFQTNIPSVPTTIYLRFLVKPKDSASWYTITLKPIHLHPDDCKKEANSKGKCQEKCQGTSHTCEINGNSRILKICGENLCEGRIRREGSARFGSGLAGLSQSQ